MPLVAPHALFARAYGEHWALGAFNTSNLEVTQAIAWALRDARAPGIIQTSETALRYAGVAVLHDLIREVAQSADVPLVLHLDHGRSLKSVQQCVAAGYPSVMIDGSALSFPENVSLTKRATEMAHAKGAWVEGELGVIPGKEGLQSGVGDGAWGGESAFTDPDQAAEFVRQTGVDALAVAVGTAHGAFRGREGIRFERLAAIHRAVSVPLVLHGGSGLPDDEIRRALAHGIAKVNIDTELREAFHDALMSHREDADVHSIDPRALFAPARDAVQRVVREKAELLGSAGRAAL